MGKANNNRVSDVEVETVKAFLIGKALEGVVSHDITLGGYKWQI